MDVHIRHLWRILFCQLRRTEKKIRSFLSADSANKFAVFLILSKLDNCNFLLVGVPDNTLIKLQHIQNHAAPLVLLNPRHASATSLLRTLHWLPVKAIRIQSKIACLCFQCIYLNSMPPRIFYLLHANYPSRTLRSLDASLCWQFLTSLLRTLEKDLSLLLDPLAGTPYHYPPEKHSV